MLLLLHEYTRIQNWANNVPCLHDEQMPASKLGCTSTRKLRRLGEQMKKASAEIVKTRQFGRSCGNRPKSCTHRIQAGGKVLPTWGRKLQDNSWDGIQMDVQMQIGWQTTTTRWMKVSKTVGATCASSCAEEQQTPKVVRRRKRSDSTQLTLTQLNQPRER